MQWRLVVNPAQRKRERDDPRPAESTTRLQTLAVTGSRALTINSASEIPTPEKHLPGK